MGVDFDLPMTAVRRTDKRLLVAANRHRARFFRRLRDDADHLH